MYPVPNHRQDLAVSLVVIVSNSGSASPAEGWSLEVNSANQRVPIFLEPVHVNGIVELPGANGAKVDLSKEDLARKTTQMSIDKGASVKGVLTYVLSNTSEGQISNNGTTFVVHFRDSKGNSYRTRKYLIGAKGQSREQ
jgi:hypothetical protein